VNPFVLFDLDNTLVDTLQLKKLRDGRRWPEVYASLDKIQLFEGIYAVWQKLKDEGVFIGVVTHSPRPYATRVLEHVKLSPDSIVAYHDLNGNRKPSPFGYERCCNGRSPSTGMAVGDERQDLMAADAFGCRVWFANNPSGPDYVSLGGK
jgi:HAD superfamily hydrolase (TIGR01549 family)